jgi:hypothetical protein
VKSHIQGKSHAKAQFRISTKNKTIAPHAAQGPAVPPEYAHNLVVANRASSRAMRVASRRGR